MTGFLNSIYALIVKMMAKMLVKFAKPGGLALSLASMILTCFVATTGRADERLGKLEVEDLRLRPTLITVENDGSEFDLSDSSFALRWTLDRRFSTYMQIGSLVSRNLPSYYATVVEDQLGFVEAYAQYDGVYGRIRAGLLPLSFGYDGQIKSSERIYKRAQTYNNRLVGLRDVGVSAWTDHNGYFTEITVHNGEVDTTQDGKIWTTARWGWTNDRNLKTQLSLQAGRTGAATTTGSGVTWAGFDETKSAIWRHSALFANWYPRNWNVVLQFGVGECEQTNLSGKSDLGRYSNGLFEATHLFTKNTGLGVRYDSFDPDHDVPGDAVDEISLAGILKSQDSTSNLYLVLTKVLEQQNEVPNDEIRLIWLMTPFSR